jgi:phosphoribosylanthranilate isomerase
MDVRIKICGITNVADAELAASLGADMIGLNFYAKSPRCIDEAMALSILDSVPDSVEPIGVFVNCPAIAHEQITYLQRFATLRNMIHTAQIHGDHQESLQSRVQWIPAFAVSDRSDLPWIKAYIEWNLATGFKVSAVLVDAHVPGQFGGTGQTAPWHLLADFDPGVPLILAGGLTPGNVADAIRIVRPYAVDVASGVESSPGKKDPDKLGRFIDAVRSV